MDHNAEQHHQDSAWKEIIEELLEDFLAFFFPRIHRDIDFSRDYTFLDKELQKIMRRSEVGKRYADKLVKVYLKSGEERWLLIHIEVQGYGEHNLAERLFIYNYRIFDRYKREVVTAVILTDTDPRYRPDRYYRKRWGFRVEMEYPIVKLIDYRKERDKLKRDVNPFALVVEAFLRYIEIRGDSKSLYGAKRQLIKALLERDYDKRRIGALLKFIDWLLRLPRELEKQLEDELPEITGGKIMPYKTSWERMAEERAMVRLEEKVGKEIKERVEQEIKEKVEQEVKERVEKKIKEKVEQEIKERVEKEVKEKAKEEEKENTAKKMLEKGFDLNLIIDITGLPEEKLIRLRGSMEKTGGYE